MKKIIALILAILMVLTLITGCKQPPSDVSAEAEQRGIVTNLAGAAATSDPFNHANLIDRSWQPNVFEPLISYNGATKEFEPLVIESWEISDDGLEYTFHVRKGIKFHNGNDCKAQQVKDSIDYGRTIAFNKANSGCIDHVDVIDEYTLKVVLSYKHAAFLVFCDRIFVVDTSVIEEQGDQFGVIANLAGTGPFYIESYDADVEIKLARFDDYYRGPSEIPSITFKVMTDSSAALIAFESGTLDFVEVSTSNYADIEASGKYNTYMAPTTQCVNLMVNNHFNEAVSNKLVRQAMAYAIDYDAVNLAGFDGYGVITGKDIYAPLTNGATENYGIVYTYQPEKAKELLAEAGYADGVNIGELFTIAGQYYEKVAQAVQACWSEVGIDCKINALEINTCLSEMRAGNYPVGVMSMYYTIDNDILSVLLSTENEATNMLKIANSPDYDWQRIDELLELGRSTTDIEERKAYYRELDDIVREACISIPLFHTSLGYAWNKDLYVNTAKSYTYYFYSFYDAHWN